MKSKSDYQSLRRQVMDYESITSEALRKALKGVSDAAGWSPGFLDPFKILKIVSPVVLRLDDGKKSLYLTSNRNSSCHHVIIM